jgi:hypothetical protein
MRTTIRLDDELLERLKREAQRQNVSLTRLINSVIEAGLASARTRRKRAFRQQVFSLGPPRVSLTKALAVASQLEDAEIAGEMLRGK